ncbi:MFS transporter [Bacillus marinisedimentorum]|uniref:MFS transporter n=1 Tax=Bacillus marinisedimentorum TaxID=1821260 RepID=UPI0007E1ED4F|nr:MFS transporter [Bacillus marinisedimentorum]
MQKSAVIPKTGIKENALQFGLLVVINLFVGSMVGLERSILPIIGEEIFGLASASAALSFIVSFGFSKAIVNLFAGNLADRIGRKQILLAGWGIGLLVPILVIFASGWELIVFANILLGINQGLTWSMTVNMKIDLAAPRERGMAVGLNEFAGYIGVGLMAFLSGYIASAYGLRPEPFYIGIALAVTGLLLSLAVQDTSKFVKAHAETHEKAGQMSGAEVFRQTTYKDKNLAGISFAGLSTNLKDGMSWGLFPLFFASAGLTIGQIGVIVAIYPIAWGIFQLFSGAWSDKVGRKGLIAAGMILQAAAIWWILLVDNYGLWITGAILLGIGTAMVYPTLIAAIGDAAHPEWRASSMGIYRFWRDSGYAFGALLAGVLADTLGVNWAMGLVAVLPLAAGINVLFRVEETLKR